jgi:hypothetical protein
MVSANTHGPTKFVGPGALDVKIEGKNVQLLSDPMLNNCGPSGNPPNSATLMGVMQMTGLMMVVPAGECPVCGKTHDSLQETEETKADAGSLAGAFRSNVAGATEEDLPISTMIGVAHCKCSAKKYADHSSGTSEEFYNAAGGYERHNHTYSYIKRGRKKKTGRRTRRNAVKSGLQNHLGNSKLFQDTWGRAEERSRHYNKKKSTPFAYPAGSCGAQGALILLMNDDAMPGALTEEWFDFHGNPTAGRGRYVDFSSGVREIAFESFESGQTVPPCRSCELIVPLMLCTDGKTKCH